MRLRELLPENFSDGKKPGRKGLAKRSGVDCKQSVTQLRKVAANSSGEKARMAHWCANMKSGRSKTNEVAIDNKSGAGSVPFNQEIDYFGLRTTMRPSTFLRLAAPLGQEHSAELEKYIADGGAIGAPFLEIKIPAEWDDGDFSKPAQVAGHEGRNRMTAVRKLEGDAPIEVHILPRGGYRARDITPEFRAALAKSLYAEKSTTLVSGPLFEEELEEGWRDTMANLAIAGAIGAGGAGGMMAKQTAQDYFKEPTAAVATTSAIKKAEVPTTFAQAKAAPSAPAAIKAEPAKKLNVQPITNNPLESVLLKVAKSSGLQGAELAAFMAQCAHETLDFKRLTEFGGSLDFRKYDPKYAPKKAKALGNKIAGDGAKFKGRGFIQITGRYNYKRAGEAIGIDLIEDPGLAEDPVIAAKIAVWFWQHRVQPNVDNFKDTTGVTKQINPGLRGLEQRKDNFADYMQVAMK
jgi:predicted chitinase